MSTGAPATAQTTISRRDLFRRVGEKAQLAIRGTVSIADHCLAVTGVSCRSCEDACTQRAIRFQPQLGGQYHPFIEPSLCTVCKDCFDVCPVAALSVKHRG